jgi:hypothetical protein
MEELATAEIVGGVMSARATVKMPVPVPAD